MAGTAYKDIKDSLTQLYMEDERPWLVGFSGGKDRESGKNRYRCFAPTLV